MHACRPLAIKYTLFLREQWLKYRLGHITKGIPHELDTQIKFKEAYQECNEGKNNICEFYLHNLVMPHSYSPLILCGGCPT